MQKNTLEKLVLEYIWDPYNGVPAGKCYDKKGDIVDDPHGLVYQELSDDYQTEFKLTSQDKNVSISFEHEFLPDFKYFFEQRGYQSLSPRGIIEPKGFDEREWPFILEGKEIFWIKCGTMFLADSASTSGIWVNVKRKDHSEWEKARTDIFDYFESYRK